VERSIQFVRGSFFAARLFADLDDLNTQAEAWCNGLAADRRCPEDPKRSVREVFAEEAPRLLSLPDNPPPPLERVAVSVGKTPYGCGDQPTRSVGPDARDGPLVVEAGGRASPEIMVRPRDIR
jgi:hypothetical protein